MTELQKLQALVDEINELTAFVDFYGLIPTKTNSNEQEFENYISLKAKAKGMAQVYQSWLQAYNSFQEHYNCCDDIDFLEHTACEKCIKLRNASIDLTACMELAKKEGLI